MTDQPTAPQTWNTLPDDPADIPFLDDHDLRMRAAANRAAAQEFDWANPECPICERQHPPDRCDLADEAEDNWPWYGWTP